MTTGSSALQETDEGASARRAAAGERTALRRILQLAIRRKWLLIGPVLAATAIAAGVLSQITPEYGATAYVAIEASQAKPEGTAPGGSPTVLEPSSRLASEVDFLQSPSLLAQVVDKLDLARDPEFGSAPPGPMARAWMWVRGQVHDLIGEKAPAQDHAASDEVAARAKAVALLSDAVSITARPPSLMIGITVRSADKAKAARIADTTTDLYVADRAQARVAAEKRASDLLKARLVGAKQDFEAADRALADFREKSGAVAGNDRTTAAQTLTELNSQLTQARLQTADRESRLKALQRAQANPASRAGVTEILASPVITALQLQEADIARRVTDLSQRYGENYPRLPEARAELAQVQGRISAEIAKIMVSMQGDVDAAQAKEAQLKAQVDQLETQVAGQRQAADELRRLQRDADLKRQAYQDLLKREGEVRDRLENGQIEVRALSAATISNEPVFPRYGRTLYAAALAGLFLGIAGIMVLERLDTGIRSTEQIESLMGAPLVGMIPLLRAAEAKISPVRLVLEKPMSVYSEALRLTHTAMTVSSGGRKCKVVMITSSVPGEGKSTFACSFATMIARSNPRKKIVLIDCDLRRSTVANLLGVVKTEGTIDQYLAGKVSLDRVFGRAEGSGLYYIPSHSNTPNSAELLASADMQAFVTALAEQFDMVILDTPPLMAVADPRIVAKLADYIIFLVRWERTDRDVAQTAFKLLAEVSDNVGVVLSQVDLRRHAKYGYSDYAASYSKYRNYYVS